MTGAKGGPPAAPGKPPTGAGAPAARPTAEPPARRGPRTLERQLFEEGYSFDFFQAVRVLAKLDPTRQPVGRAGSPAREIARFRAHASLSFPPSAIYDIERSGEGRPAPLMIVAFLGLTGPSGILPRHYTELLLRIDREVKHDEKHSLRDWLALFDHRLISLFYRAWEKYRFWIPYERGEYRLPEPDPFTRSLLSFIGLGMKPLRDRLGVSIIETIDDQEREKPLARIDDLALLHYSGFLAQRTRNAISLEAMLQDYFQMPVRVRQFQGQWLLIGAGNQSRLAEGNNQLGLNVVAGERVWDVQSKFRVRVGPLRYPQFNEFLPDSAPVPRRKSFFLLSHLIRLYAGMELDFDVQLILKAEDVPPCRLDESDGIGARLGWNTWLCSQPPLADADEAVFEGDPLRWISSHETIDQ